MNIEEVQSTTKKQRIATHTHIKGLGLEVCQQSTLFLFPFQRSGFLKTFLFYCFTSFRPKWGLFLVGFIQHFENYFPELIFLTRCHGTVLFLVMFLCSPVEEQLIWLLALWVRWRLEKQLVL